MWPVLSPLLPLSSVQFFYRGTELQHIADEYHSLKEKHESTSQLLVAHKDQLARMKEEVVAAEKRYKVGKKCVVALLLCDKLSTKVTATYSLSLPFANTFRRCKTTTNKKRNAIFCCEKWPGLSFASTRM